MPAAARKPAKQQQQDPDALTEEERQFLEGGKEPGAEAAEPDEEELSFQELLAQNRELLLRDMDARLDQRMKPMTDFMTEYQTGQRQTQAAIAGAEKARKRPDSKTDPLGALNFDWQERFDALTNRLQPALEKLTGIEQETVQTREQALFQTWANNDINSCRQRHEDYDGTANGLFETLHAFAMDCGFDRQQAANILNTFVTALSNGARQRGVSAAENFYRLGKMITYQQQAPAGTQVPPGMQQQRSPLARATSELERLRTGPRLKGAGGGSGTDRNNRLGYLPPDQFDRLSDDEYARLMANPKTASQLRRNFEALEGYIPEQQQLDYEM